MKNKKAQWFSLILPFITLFMCCSSIYVYTIQQKDIESSLVSPLVVLQIRDNLTIFEMKEKELIEKSLNEVKISFANNEFTEKFKEIFINGIDDEMKKFVLNNLTRQGKIMNSMEFDEDSFFKNILYSKVEKDSNGLKFIRSKIGKKISLRANDKTKTNFPMDFLFEFEREYLISFEKDKFKVRIV